MSGEHPLGEINGPQSISMRGYNSTMNSPNYCKCGCGNEVNFTYLRGHNRRGGVRASEASKRKMSQSSLGNPGVSGANNPMWSGADISYQGLHKWLRRNFPKTGVCERCGKEAGTTGTGRGTDYANISGAYSRERSDYLELCRSCHAKIDGFVDNFRGLGDVG